MSFDRGHNATAEGWRVSLERFVPRHVDHVRMMYNERYAHLVSNINATPATDIIIIIIIILIIIITFLKK